MEGEPGVDTWDETVEGDGRPLQYALCELALLGRLPAWSGVAVCSK